MTNDHLIRNPATGRWINKHGKLVENILKDIRKSPKQIDTTFVLDATFNIRLWTISNRIVYNYTLDDDEFKIVKALVMNFLISGKKKLYNHMARFTEDVVFKYEINEGLASIDTFHPTISHGSDKRAKVNVSVIVTRNSTPSYVGNMDILKGLKFVCCNVDCGSFCVGDIKYTVEIYGGK